MSTPPTLLDTDILSALMRRDPTATPRARAYLGDHSRLTISLVTRYEILRGLKARGAAKQEAAFHAWCASNEILPLGDVILERAAALYADLYRRGSLIGDADLLIAATALEHGLVLATNNEAHFGRIAGLTIDNWPK